MAFIITHTAACSRRLSYNHAIIALSLKTLPLSQSLLPEKLLETVNALCQWACDTVTG